MTQNYTPCNGSRKVPNEVTQEPDTYIDSYHHLCGNYGKGICSVCEREIGLNKNGEITAHKDARTSQLTP